MVVKKIAKVLRGAGYAVATGRKINNLTPRGVATVDGLGVIKSAFVNVPTPYTMLDGASHLEMAGSSTEAACRAAALLAEAGLVTYTPLHWFRGADGRDHASKPLGGFWVVGDFFNEGGRPND